LNVAGRAEGGLLMRVRTLFWLWPIRLAGPARAAGCSGEVAL
jgi:hypothetical protein